MHAGLKKSIIESYMEQKRSPLGLASIVGIQGMPYYEELGKVLDALESSYDNDPLDFSNVLFDNRAWENLSNVLDSGLRFTAAGNIDRINYQTMKDYIADKKLAIQFNSLPQPDYYNRKTATDAVRQGNIQHVIDRARDKLVDLLQQSHIQQDTGLVINHVNPNNKKHVEVLIKQLNEHIKANPGQAEVAKKYLTLAEDLNKIHGLTVMSIPTEKGEEHYCTLAEAAGGVTEKVSLVHMNKVIAQLSRLVADQPASVDDYINNRRDYKLSTEAILKLPKHGDIKEVQREAIALNVSRILGMDTTESSIMTYNDKPALFVPFADIRLMSDFAHGKNFTAGSKTYQHYATVDPVGSGLQGNQYVEDFGKSMGLFYICSDTDAIGGYNQNKALRNAHSLFVFDQVVMPKDKFELGTNLSLIPSQPIMKHTRHGQGRNRTLIEDSSLESKFNSMTNLLRKQVQIEDYVMRTVSMHAQKITELQQKLAQPGLDVQEKNNLEKQKVEAIVLEKDARTIGIAINERIAEIRKVLPEWKDKRSENEKLKDQGAVGTYIKQALILEKLLQNPRLFTDEGRPYRNPWISRSKNPVQSIKPLNNGSMLLTFDSEVPSDMMRLLQKHGEVGTRLSDKKEIVISREDLLALKETMLHPEFQTRIQHDVNYLDPEDLRQIKEAYEEGNRDKILDKVSQYTKVMNNGGISEEDKLKTIEKTLFLLRQEIDKSGTKDKGFGMHVLKKLHFDIQQQLQKMIPQHEKPKNLDQAFKAALKLDRVDVFNNVMADAIKHKQINSPAFRDFLQTCITQAAQATNHEEALQASHRIEQDGGQLLKQELASFQFKVVSDTSLLDHLKSEVNKINSNQIQNSVDMDEALDHYTVGMARLSELQNEGQELSGPGKDINQQISLTQLIGKRKTLLKETLNEVIYGILVNKVNEINPENEQCRPELLMLKSDVDVITQTLPAEIKERLASLFTAKVEQLDNYDKEMVRQEEANQQSSLVEHKL